MFFFTLNQYFFIFLNYFDVLILKIIFKNKKYYFNIFLNKKYTLINNKIILLNTPKNIVCNVLHPQIDCSLPLVTRIPAKTELPITQGRPVKVTYQRHVGCLDQLSLELRPRSCGLRI